MVENSPPSIDNSRLPPRILWDEWRVFAGDAAEDWNLPDSLNVADLLSCGLSDSSLVDFVKANSEGECLTIKSLLNLSMTDLVRYWDEATADAVTNAVGLLAADYAASQWGLHCSATLKDRADLAERDPGFKASFLNQRSRNVRACSLGHELERLSPELTLGFLCDALLEEPQLLPVLIRFDLETYFCLWQHLEALDLLPSDIRLRGAMAWRKSWLSRFPESHGVSLPGEPDHWIKISRIHDFRTWELLCARYGIIAASPTDRSSEIEKWCPCTFADVAKQFGVSRERARQMESIALGRLGTGNALENVTLVLRTLKCLTKNVGGVLSIADAAHQMGQIFDFNRARLSPSGICGLFFLWDETGFVPLIRNKVYAVSELMDANRFQAIIREAELRQHQANWNGTDFTVDENLSVSIACSLGILPDALPMPLLSSCLRAAGKLFEETDTRHLPLRPLIVRVLKQAGQPMHFSEVSTAVDTLKCRQSAVTTSSVHTVLCTDRNLFVCTGSGTYGLTEWNLAEHRETDRGKNYELIADIIESLLRSCETPISQNDIVNHVLAKKRCRVTSIEQALCRDLRFLKAGSRWMLAERRRDNLEDDWFIPNAGRVQADKGISDPATNTEALLDMLLGDFGSGKWV